MEFSRDFSEDLVKESKDIGNTSNKISYFSREVAGTILLLHLVDRWSEIMQQLMPQTPS